MKKYKLYENGMDRLEKILTMSNQVNEEPSFVHKIYLMAGLSSLVVSEFQLCSNLGDNLFVTSLNNFLLGIVIGQAFHCINNNKNKKNSIKKLDEIVRRLNENNIEITTEELLNASLDFDLIGDEFHLTNVLLGEKSIIRLSDIETVFVDKDEFIDITDIINESTLTKRQSRKYRNSKQNK